MKPYIIPVGATLLMPITFFMLRDVPRSEAQPIYLSVIIFSVLAVVIDGIISRNRKNPKSRV